MFLKYWVLIILFFSSIIVRAQDVIMKIDGDEVLSKILEVGTTQVKYKKFDDVSGSIFVLDKNQIFMIKYEDGTKDVFGLNTDTVVVLVEAEKELKITRESLVIDRDMKFKYDSVDHGVYFLGEEIKSKRRAVYDYQFDIDKVFETPILHYYGVDLSVVHLYNKKKLKTEPNLFQYVAAWETSFYKDYPPHEYLKRWINKEQLVEHFEYSSERNKRKGGIWVNDYPSSLTLPEIYSIIMDYKKNIKEVSGVGYLFIADCFNKPENAVYGVHVFFDIQTGDFLWVTQAIGPCGGGGMTGFWASGLLICTRDFVNEVYKGQEAIYKHKIRQRQ